MTNTVSGIPTRKQQNFIFQELIPAILREGGLGFAMETWRTTKGNLDLRFKNFDFELVIDGLPRSAPKKCNSVCCIGGTIESLCKTRAAIRNMDSDERTTLLGKKLGLMPSESHALFFNWDHETSNKYSWPVVEATRFRNAKTPLEKAQVVAGLLIRIATEGGKILRRQ
jgi:hypothetical protein